MRQQWVAKTILGGEMLVLALGLTTVHAAALDNIANPAPRREQLNELPNLPPLLTNSTQFQRDWWLFQQRASPLGFIPKNARMRALHEIEQFHASEPGT